MPYKNPEHKRQWEREHHEQRNAQRRAQRLSAVTRPIALNPTPKAVSAHEPANGWKLIIALVVVISCAVVGVLSGARMPKGR